MNYQQWSNDIISIWYHNDIHFSYDDGRLKQLWEWLWVNPFAEDYMQVENAKTLLYLYYQRDYPEVELPDILEEMFLFYRY